MSVSPLKMIPPTQLPLASRWAFTLIEMLISMALAMLMMAALARSFSYVSSQVRDSRAETELSSELRGLSTRIIDEFDQRTCSLQPAHAGYEPSGYVLYHEGGVTDATSSLFRTTAVDGEILSRDARYGDFDDYLAFTATAPGDSWFTGKVPRYVLDSKSADVAGTAYTVPTFGSNPVGHRAAFEPVMIKSKHAEIIYYCSPEYTAASLPASPAFVDIEGDEDPVDATTTGNGFPDRMRLHRRVLLIRPDLNIAGQLPVATQGNGSVSVDFLRSDDWPTADTADITGAATPADGYLYGMAAAHQQCDLSIRRARTGTGAFTNNVAANSLEDLSIPGNRFAHVNIPSTVFVGGGATLPMSMPVLALQNSLGIFEAMTLPPMSADIAPPRTPSAGPVVTPSLVSSFIRPEFVLGLDLTHRDIPGDGWGIDRLGEDVIASGVLGFDVQVYDPDVKYVDTSLFDTDATNLIVGPSEAGYREALLEAFTQLAAFTGTPARSIDYYTEAGGYVDLCYPVLAGGSIRGWAANRTDRQSTVNNAIVPTTANTLITPFSGVAFHGTNNASNNDAPRVLAYQPSLGQSGRYLTAGTNGTSIRLFQPAFDTYTNHYELDGITQAPPNGLSVGSRMLYPTPPVTPDAGSDGLDTNGVYGIDDPTERETTPPFTAKPESLRVTFRLENSAVRAVRQLSAVLRD